MTILEIIFSIFLFIQPIVLLIMGAFATSETAKINYAIFAIISYIAFTIFTSNILIWNTLSKIKKQIKLRLNPREVEEMISQQVKKQLPDTDKVFKFFGWFITVSIFIFTIIIAIIIALINRL